MGWPGTGVALRLGIPGRAEGGACPGMGRCCCCRRATISGRGGTTGRAVGCPASAGRGWGRKGVPGVGVDAGVDAAVDDGPAASAGGAGVGRGTGCAGRVMEAGGMGAAGVASGIGCRGPDRIWPGRGAGTGRAGTGPVRNGG